MGHGVYALVGIVFIGMSLTARAEQVSTQGDPSAGREFALHACTPCHIVSSSQGSPRQPATAPSFEAIANTKAMTASALHAFLSSPHATMPSLALERQDEKNVIAYILSLHR